MTAPGVASTHTPQMQHWLADLAQQLAAGHPQVLITVGATRGSTPRDTGARMWVGPASITDTVGGGHLEWKAIAHARTMLEGGGPRRQVLRFPLGPALGQCCGGVVWLMFEYLDHDDAQWCGALAQSVRAGTPICRFVPANEGEVSLSPVNQNATAGLDAHGNLTDIWGGRRGCVVVCGAGNIGAAIVRLLGDLPVDVIWLDPRHPVGPAALPPNIQTVCGNEDDIPDMPDDALWLVMTHNHALDLAIIDAVFRHRRFAFMGLIGSATKRVRFVSRLRQRHDPAMVDRIRCPVGLVATSAKEPAVIAVSVVAQLLEQLDT